MHESTERKRRLRQKRRDANIQAYEVWLPKVLVDEVKCPDESINALVSRALNLLRDRTPQKTSHETSPNFRGFHVIDEPARPTTRIQYEIVETRDDAHVPSHETSPKPLTADLRYEQRRPALVQRIRAMKAEGLSTQTIANRLNAEGVPTLSGRGAWQKGTVGNLLTQAEEHS
jgi:hypothetical protein